MDKRQLVNHLFQQTATRSINEAADKIDPLYLVQIRWVLPSRANVMCNTIYFSETGDEVQISGVRVERYSGRL